MMGEHPRASQLCSGTEVRGEGGRTEGEGVRGRVEGRVRGQGGH